MNLKRRCKIPYNVCFPLKGITSYKVHQQILRLIKSIIIELHQKMKNKLSTSISKNLDNLKQISVTKRSLCLSSMSIIKLIFLLMVTRL